MRVIRSNTGARVVIEADHRPDTYIAARVDSPGHSRIEFYRSGRLQFSERVTNVRAPSRIVDIARGERL